jgi:polyhydroxybutyrate depolymerase
MVLHADNSTAAEIMTQTGFSALSNRKEFIVVYPDGTGLKKLSWNDGNCCGYAAQSGVNDVAFLDLIIRELAAKYNIKPNEIFVCGFQHGANMVYKYACETKTVISGIAIVGNTTYNNKCKPTHNIKALFVRDTTIAVIKNKVFFKKKKKQADAGIPAHVEFWIMSNNCLPNATNEVKNDCQIKIFYNSQQSERVRMVQFYKPLSSWPGEVTEYSSNKISSFKATDEIWNFFTSK